MIIYADKIYHATKNKAGEPYIGKTGRPFVRVSIKDVEGVYYGMLDFNGFASTWTDGMTIDTDALGLTVTETMYNGKKQFNLEIPKGAPQPVSNVEARLAKVETRLNAMLQFLKEKFPNPNQNE